MLNFNKSQWADREFVFSSSVISSLPFLKIYWDGKRYILLSSVLIFLLAVDHDIRFVKNKQDFGLIKITYHVQKKPDQGLSRDLFSFSSYA